MRHVLTMVALSTVSLVAFSGACGGDDDTDSPSAGSTSTGAGGGGGVGAGGGGKDGGSDAPDDVPARPTKPFDWIGVVGTGQSLSVGATSQAMSIRQPFGNMKLVDTGPDPKYPIAADMGTPMWAATPLVEPIRQFSPGTGPGYDDGQYPNNVGGETPHSGMANTLSALWKARGGEGEYVTVHSVVGWSGHPIVDIDKAGGKRAYPASLNEGAVWKGLAAAAGKTFGYGGIILTHGESDEGNPDYGAGLFQLWQDYNADLKALTGQTEDVVLFVSQQSTIGSGNPGNSAVQVWKAGVDHAGQIICTGPKYQYQYSADNLHFEAPGYERLGQKYAEVFELVVDQKVPWKPLQPSKITRAGAVITIDLDVPNPPLVWDTHISPPHQQQNTAWANGHGFEVKDGSGAPLTIADAEIQGTSVILTLDADPGAGTVNVAYAVTQDGSGLQGGTDQGLRGQLRDSDEFVGYDAETIEAELTMGSAQIASTAPGAFTRRAGRDIVTGTGVPADTIVLSHDSDDQLTLSAPWSGATGKVMLAFRHDERNYSVHFAMDVQ